MLEDGMALLDVDLKLFDEVKNDQRYKDLLQEVEDSDADVVTKAVLEGAIIAVDGDVKLKPIYDETSGSHLPRALHRSLSP